MKLNPLKLFKIYLLSLLIGTTHIIGIWLLAIPLGLGFVFLSKYKKLLLKNKLLSMFLSFAIVGAIYSIIYKGNYLDLAHSFKSILLLLSNVGVVLLLVKFDKSKLYTLTFYINIIAICLLVLGKLLGYTAEDTVKIVFLGSSYHLITWLLLMLNSIVLIEFSKVGNLDKKKLLIIGVLMLGAFILLSGRTGIVIGFMLFLFILHKYYKVGVLLLALILFPSIYIFMDGISLDSLMQIFGGDIYERGAKLGPREWIWGCYSSGLTANDLIFGFNQYDVAGKCIEQIGFDIRTESSFLSLVSEVGIFSIILLLLILVGVYKSIYISGMILPVFLAIIIRVSTGDFLFFTIFDWIILYVAFGIRDEKRKLYERK